MKKPCSSAGHRWARQTDPGLRGGGFSLPLLLFHRLVVLFFFSLVLFVPPRSNRSGKKGKKGRKKKKKRNLFFWLGVNYFLLIISQKTDPNTKASIINTLLCLCVLARKKHFFGVRRKFFSRVNPQKSCDLTRIRSTRPGCFRFFSSTAPEHVYTYIFQ